MPTTILASRYNTLRNQVNQVLGDSSTSAPTYGYGQAFSTNSVVGTRSVSTPSNADKISAQDYEDLYIDLIRVRSHQVGASVTINEFVVGDYETNTINTDKVEEAYIAGLESLAANIATDRLTVDLNNLTITSLPSASSTRLGTSDAGGTSWNGEISHIFTISFANNTERRHFFNTGSEIRISARVDYTGSQAKTVDWQTILNAMGSISFKAEETFSNTSVGIGTSIGNYDLTSSYQLIYSRTGGSVYASNRYNIYAREYSTGNSSSAIQFKVEFIDGTPSGGSTIDEQVVGRFNSIVETASADSQVNINGTTHDAVVIDTLPAGANVRNLS